MSGTTGQWISMRKSGFVKPFYVVLANTTNEPQRVFEAWNGWGYKAISFELLTDDGQRAILSRSDQDFDKNYPSTFILLPGESYVSTVQLTNGDWIVTPGIHFPNGNLIAVHLKAIYQLTPTRESRSAAAKNIWIGHVESKDYFFHLAHE